MTSLFVQVRGSTELPGHTLAKRTYEYRADGNLPGANASANVTCVTLSLKVTERTRTLVPKLRGRGGKRGRERGTGGVLYAPFRGFLLRALQGSDLYLLT